MAAQARRVTDKRRLRWQNPDRAYRNQERERRQHNARKRQAWQLVRFLRGELV